jgi:hypothetical protein
VIIMPLNVPGARTATITVLNAFADAYNRHDVDAIMALMTEDCVFVSYFGPESDGERFVGCEAVRARVSAGLADFPDARWSDVRHLVDGNRAVSEWIFTGTRRGTHLPVERHGCDIFTLRSGKIAEKNTYQKWRQPK